MSTGPSQASQPFRSHLVPASDRLSRLPYWLLAALLLGVLAFWTIATNEDYRIIFDAVRKGVWTTIYVSVVSYTFATFGGCPGA